MGAADVLSRSLANGANIFLTAAELEQRRKQFADQIALQTAIENRRAAVEAQKIEQDNTRIGQEGERINLLTKKFEMDNAKDEQGRAEAAAPTAPAVQFTPEEKLGAMNEYRTAAGMPPLKSLQDLEPIAAVDPKTQSEINLNKSRQSYVEAQTANEKNKPASGAPGAAPKMTEVQSNAFQFADVMGATNKLLGEIEGGGYDPAELDTKNVWSSVAPRIAQNPQFRSYQDTKRTWIAAALRKESGAAISENEYKQKDTQYFPQIGDTPEEKQKKATLRQIAEQNMRTAAGPGSDAGAYSSGKVPLPSSGEKPEAAQQSAMDIRSAVKSGKMSREDGIKKLRELGFQ